VAPVRTGPPPASVVIPALNEAGNIARLVEETYATVPAELLAEVIVVDDGSTDGTGEEVTALLPRYPSLRYLRHAERCGQSTALRTGVLAASSTVIATMDGDGQNDPRDITELLRHLGQPGSGGPALVGGHRVNRKAVGSRRLASRIGNGIRSYLLKDGSPDTGCGVKVFWRDVFVRLPFFTSMHRYLPMMFRCYGQETVYVPVNDRPRLAGTSKYTNFGRLLVSIYDLVGVIWLRKRTKVPKIAVDSSGVKRLWALTETPVLRAMPGARQEPSVELARASNTESGSAVRLEIGTKTGT
jgi:dolichol-phosphate mannosyltransferase